MLSFNISAQNEAFKPTRELRGAWLTTLFNIDWPSSSKLTSAVQKEELLELLQQYQDLGINVIYFQIRPCSDAFYNSNYEPWSEYLTGERGKAPHHFDPLQFAIYEAHKRGMELHAWINPFRLLHNPSDDELELFLNQFSLAEQCVFYNNQLFLDPGYKESHQYVQNIIKDVCENYDIDGIHFDDYFYPYPKKGMHFNDFKSYALNGNNLDLEEWRCNNINWFIYNVQMYIWKEQPDIEFGVSPFGVWANALEVTTGSQTEAGTSTLLGNFADTRKWAQKGWVDYITPQLYWYIGHPTADFKTLATWWNSIDSKVPIYVGHSIYKFDEKSKIREWRSSAEIERQINLVRSLANLKGNSYYNTSCLIKNACGVSDRIKTLNNNFAIPPIKRRWNKKISDAPQAQCKTQKASCEIKVKAKDEDRFALVVLTQKDNEKLKRIPLIMMAAEDNWITVDLKNKVRKGNFSIEVYAVNKYRALSKPKVFFFKKSKRKVRLILER